MGKRTFTKQELRDILWGEDEDAEIILNKITDTSRWDTHYRFIFKKGGKLWETTYSRGSTEQQDSQRPWEYVDEEECVEVEAFEKTVTDYREVSDE